LLCLWRKLLSNMFTFFLSYSSTSRRRVYFCELFIYCCLFWRPSNIYILYFTTVIIIIIITLNIAFKSGHAVV
jgi:hypothetical protein